MLNMVVLMGRLTANPELKTTSNNLSICHFTLAVDRQYSKDKTDFINCIAWRSTAEFISKYFTRGKMIAVIGAIETGSYIDKNGNTRYTFEVNVNNVHFCGSVEKKETETNVSKRETEQEMPLDDDLPF